MNNKNINSAPALIGPDFAVDASSAIRHIEGIVAAQGRIEWKLNCNLYKKSREWPAMQEDVRNHVEWLHGLYGIMCQCISHEVSLVPDVCRAVESKCLSILDRRED